MPSGDDESLIDSIDDHLAELPECQKLESIPEPFKAKFRHCWRVPISFPSGTYYLLIFLDGNFPFSLPRVAVEDGPPILTWPHLESNGMLCVLPSTATGDWSKPLQMIDNVLKEAYLLTQRNLDQSKKLEIEEEFRNEFLSYWDHACGANAKQAISLVEPQGPSRMVYVFKTQRKWYFADTSEQLTTWLQNLKIVPKKPIRIERACLLWLQKAWVPDEYPKSTTDIESLLRLHSGKIPDADIIECTAAGLNLLVGMQTADGYCLAGFTHRPPLPTKLGPSRNSGDPVSKGFRPNNVPKSLARQRAMGASAKVNRIFVRRADHRWIQGRDQNEAEIQLAQKHVNIVGVGSLGSEVALLLAKSGVGHLALNDADSLEWANISRHALGANYVGGKKASGLKDYLGVAYPHVHVEAVCESLSRSNPNSNDNLFKTDLVMMLTGEWSTTAWANTKWLGANRPKPVILGWLEAHALATHSVHFSTQPNAACIACGFNTLGKAKLPVVNFHNSPILQQPACGGSFVPYGAVALSRSAGIIAKQAISVLLNQSKTEDHVVAICSNDERELTGAEWAEQWLEKEGDPEKGETITRRVWSKDANCPHCGTSAP